MTGLEEFPSYSDMNDETLYALLTEKMAQSRVPVVVMGSGMSAGVGAPTMGAVHKYLESKVERQSSETAGTIVGLLETLKESVTPRSVQVRLYNLLQTSNEPAIKRVWQNFGAHLVDGTVAGGKPKRSLAQLRPSEAHLWAARLAIKRHAVIISLNYDGLTGKAVEVEAEQIFELKKGRTFKTARILSSAAQLDSFYSGDEDEKISARAISTPTLGGIGGTTWRPIPIIKARGDVFHAVCSNGRCPEIGKEAPIYALLSKDRAKQSGHDLLRCQVCGGDRRLQISFPGVFGKEQDIDSTLASFHRFYGMRIAGIIFLGFSGTWDEALVRYLAEQAKILEAPFVSLSNKETPTLRKVATDAGLTYIPIQFQAYDDHLSRDQERARLEKIFDTSAEAASGAGPHKIQDHVKFPDDAFSLLNSSGMEILVGKDCRVKLDSEAGADTFANAAAGAFQNSLITRLQRCSQLGLKGIFLRETSEDIKKHNRFRHSTSATLIGLLWRDALLRNSTAAGHWASSREATLAMEMAILFHDARHLPFSHMMEEVFGELNWGKIPSVSWPDIVRYMEDIEVNRQLSDVLNLALPDIFTAITPKDWWKHVSALQDGFSGSPWLEAIVDSALDADKIEYIFHDTKLTGQRVRLSDWKAWFETFLSEQRLTPEGLIRLEGESCQAAFELLQERNHLYRRLYHAPELRALECLSRYIVLTWLKWGVPDTLSTVSGMRYRRDSDLRAAKVEAAGKLVWEIFQPSSGVNNELEGLARMTSALMQNPFIDDAAKAWVSQIWKILECFKVEEGQQPSRQLALSAYGRLNPIGPLYIHRDFEKPVRAIARNFRVHFPLIGLIDLAVFPRFLATPSVRSKRIGASRAIAEHFLVPGASPNKWRRGTPATTPLHLCDFSGFEFPVIQIIVLDPWGAASGGSAFLYEMLMREMQARGIEHAESPEGAIELRH